MKLKTLLVIKAIVSLVFGIPVLIVPDKWMSLFGLALGAEGMFVARHNLSGLMNPLGWAIVVAYLFFTIAFGYILVRKPVDI